MQLSTISLALTRLGGLFSPASLFLGGTAGAWYDPSDLTTLFTTSAGTTQCAMPGQGSAVSVGLMLDKSQGVQRFWSGYFDGTGDYLSTAASAGIAFGTGDFTIEGWCYSFDVSSSTQRGIFQTSDTAGGLKPSYPTGVTLVFGSSGSGSLGAQVGGTAYSSAGALVRASTWFHFAVTRASGAVNIWLNGVSVASGAGNTANLIGQFAAIGGYYNTTYLLNGYVSNFRIVKGTAIYTGTFTPPSPVTGLTAISGTSLLTCQNSTFIDNSGNNVAITANGNTTTSQNIPLGNHAIAFNDTTARPELRARVNLLVATATLSTQSVTTQATSYTLSFAGTGSITLSGTATGSYSAGTHTITCTAGTLTLTVSGTVTTADLRPANSGALLPAYQAIVDANTYDTSGFPLYLRFDGIDDSMYTPANLDLSGTDKVAVFAGVRKNDNTTIHQLVELSAAIGTNAGAFSMPTNDIGAGRWSTYLNGSTGAVSASAAGTIAPITTVNTALYDIALSADEARLRINGTQVATSGASSAGAGNFGTYPLYIGSRANSGLFFNGHLHSLIIAGSAVSAGNISAAEQWVAQRTGIVIP